MQSFFNLNVLPGFGGNLGAVSGGGLSWPIWDLCDADIFRILSSPCLVEDGFLLWISSGSCFVLLLSVSTSFTILAPWIFLLLCSSTEARYFSFSSLHSSTKFEGNTPTRPPYLPFHHPSSTSPINSRTWSTLSSSSSSCTGWYENSTLHLFLFLIWTGSPEEDCWRFVEELDGST